MLLGTIQTDLKNAQLARDEVKVSALRMLLSEIHNMNIQKEKTTIGKTFLKNQERWRRRRQKGKL